MKRIIPAAIRSKVVHLNNCKGQNVYLIGTAHFSKKSLGDVTELIKNLRPKGVFLEMCEARMEFKNEKLLTLPKTFKEFREWISLVRSEEGNFLYLIISSYMSKLVERIDTTEEIDDEFSVAKEEALKLGSVVTYGDRPIDVTMKRAWTGLSIYEKLKFMFALSIQSLYVKFFISKADMNEVVEEFTDPSMNFEEGVRIFERIFPWMTACFVTERDMFLTIKLAQSLEELESGDMVAVVGAGHLGGIEKFWNDNQELLQSPEEMSKLCHTLMQYPGSNDGKFTVRDMRAYAKRFLKELKQKRSQGNRG